MILACLGTVARADDKSPAQGPWLIKDAICPAGCDTAMQTKIKDLKGKQVVLTTDRYENPIEGWTDKCKTGVDFSHLTMQPGDAFVHSLPIEKDGHGSTSDFDSGKLGVSDQMMLAGPLLCQGGGALTITFLPKKDQLHLILDGGIFAILARSLKP